MPIYRYRCENCAHEFKLFLPSPNGETTAVCQRCGESAARRLLARVATIYKGSGFYTTSSYRKNGSTDSGSSEAESSSKATSQSDTSQEH